MTGQAEGKETMMSHLVFVVMRSRLNPEASKLEVVSQEPKLAVTGARSA
jgi:hypothetical protein